MYNNNGLYDQENFDRTSIGTVKRSQSQDTSSISDPLNFRKNFQQSRSIPPTMIQGSGLENQLQNAMTRRSLLEREIQELSEFGSLSISDDMSPTNHRQHPPQNEFPQSAVPFVTKSREVIPTTHEQNQVQERPWNGVADYQQHRNQMLAQQQAMIRTQGAALNPQQNFQQHEENQQRFSQLQATPQNVMSVYHDTQMTVHRNQPPQQQHQLNQLQSQQQQFQQQNQHFNQQQNHNQSVAASHQQQQQSPHVFRGHDSSSGNYINNDHHHHQQLPIQQGNPGFYSQQQFYRPESTLSQHYFAQQLQPLIVSPGVSRANSSNTPIHGISRANSGSSPAHAMLPRGNSTPSNFNSNTPSNSNFSSNKSTPSNAGHFTLGQRTYSNSSTTSGYTTSDNRSRTASMLSSTSFSPSSLLRQTGKPQQMITAAPAPDIIYQVQFKCGTRDFVPHTRAAMQTYSPGDFVVTQCHQGVDLGVVTEAMSRSTFIERRYFAKLASEVVDGPEGGVDREDAAVAHIMRLATEAERKSLTEKDRDERAATEVCIRLATVKYSLPMEIVDTEYQFDRQKLTVYYTSEGRVDFRDLVKELNSMYKTRVWMKKAPEKSFFSLIDTVSNFPGLEPDDTSQQLSEKWDQL